MSHRLLCRRRETRSGEHAQDALTGAEVGRLRRHVRPRYDGARCFRCPIVIRCGVAAAGDTEGAGPAEANLTDFALTCTVLTRTGFIGSVAPGTASMGWVLITPLVKAQVRL